MLRASIDTENAALNGAFAQLKEVSNSLFENLHTELTDSQIKIAFPGTKISFQFNPDTKIDIYKSTLIYVDDGFNSLLQDKGSGIQSAVIIGLFDYYTRKIAHSSSSLLAVEEPELYLHPQARRVISNRLDGFLDANKNQVIITTHSSEFITAAYERINIILARKEDGQTTACNTVFEHSRDKQILLKSQNTEMFFADKVVVVEGGEKYILESICQHFGRVTRVDLGQNWLNDKNISIISAGGKNEFWKYHNKLAELKIPVIIISDFDFFLRGLSEFLTKVGMNDLKEPLDTLKGRLGDITKKKKLSDFNEEERSQIANEIAKMRAINVHILTNELEDNYTEKAKEGVVGVSGKEEKPIHIVANLVDSDNPITDFIQSEEYLNIIQTLI